MKSTLHKIAFIGGIHGVGKSTVCSLVCKELNLGYLSASELLRWKELVENPKAKTVENIPSTQERLIKGLEAHVEKGGSYLLDGHYCLLNGSGEITNVPIETFQQINPLSLHIVIGDPSEVKRRLESRDNISYDLELLRMLHQQELQYAQELSTTLSVPLGICTQDDFSMVVEIINESFAMP
jgi:adenylate kinase